MFDVEQAIADWRAKMAARAVDDPEWLDELESHLRDEIEALEQTGLAAERAFEEAVTRIGMPGALKKEFRKVGGFIAMRRRIRRGLLTLAGIVNQEDTLMHTSSSATALIEPRWITYSKAGAFLLPALTLWGFSNLFLFPKLQWICNQAGIAIPGIFRLVNPVAGQGMWIAMVLAAPFILLEWNSANWPRYRRTTIGVSVFVVNTGVLVLITAMVVLALVAAPSLIHH